METVKYIVKRILIALLILFGVSIIIYMLARMMPTDYVDNQYLPAVSNGMMSQEDVDRIKEIYGLNVPDAYLSVKTDAKTSAVSGKSFTKNTKEITYDKIQRGVMSREEWYTGSYDAGEYRIYLDSTSEKIDGVSVFTPTTYRIYTVHMRGTSVVEGVGEDDKTESYDNSVITLDEELRPVEQGTWSVNEDGTIAFVLTHSAENGSWKEETPFAFNADMIYRVASFWDKAGALFGGYFNWLGNLVQGEFGMSFKYKKPVQTVIVSNMGISFAIAFIATILQFAIAIPLGIKAATNQYGVVDYTVTVLTMMGISLPTFFLAAIVIRLFSVQLGWFPVNGLVSSLPTDASWFLRMGDMLWHMVLPMFVLVVLSVGSLMRYTRTNTLEVLNADYIRTARAKGLSERSVVYKHAFRNTMIPLVTMMAGILPSLFGGAMITETVFAIPGIGKLAYDALIVADVPFIMGYNMFIAIMTVLGTLLSDLMYAVVDPRVKIGR